MSSVTLKTTLLRRSRLAVGACLCSLTLLGACVSNGSSASNFSSSQAQREQTVRFGQVVSVREVTIQGGGSGVGAVSGAVVGGVAGSNIGGGNGRIVGGVLGAVAGGVAGNAIESGVTRSQGVEITVRLENGQTIAVTQANDQSIRNGDRVRVLSDRNTTRVVRD